MKKIIVLFSIALLEFSTFSQEIDYLGQTPPNGNTVKFAEGIVSVTDRNDYALAVAPGGNEIFFTAEEPGVGLMVVRKSNGIWGNPEKANLTDNKFEFEAFYTPDGSKLFFSTCNSSDCTTDKSSRIFYSLKDSSNQWQTGVKLDAPFNNTEVFYSTVTKEGTIYYTDVSTFNIYSSELKDLLYQSSKLIFKGMHSFISPDESFILFNSSGYGGFGKSDIFVAFKKEDGSGWSEIKNLGQNINTAVSETCPSLSPDGKYIFFSRYNDTNGKSDIYWSSAGIIDSLKKITTNEIKNIINDNQLLIYPNPASLTIQIMRGDNVLKISSYKLFDINGKMVKQGTPESDKIDISDLNKGLYLIQLKAVNEIISRRFIVE